MIDPNDDSYLRHIPEEFSIDIYLDTLIQKVVISPNATKYFVEPFKMMVESHGIDPGKVIRLYNDLI